MERQAVSELNRGKQYKIPNLACAVVWVAKSLYGINISVLFCKSKGYLTLSVLDEERSWRVSSCAKSYNKAKEFWHPCLYLIPVWQGSCFLSQIYEQFRFVLFFVLREAIFSYLKVKTILFFKELTDFQKSDYFMEKGGFLYIVWLFGTKVIIEYSLPFVVQA